MIFILNEYLRDKYQGKDNVYNGKSPYDILGKKIDNLFVCAFKKIDFFFLNDYLEKHLV